MLSDTATASTRMDVFTVYLSSCLCVCVREAKNKNSYKVKCSLIIFLRLSFPEHPSFYVCISFLSVCVHSIRVGDHTSVYSSL